jgi:hypothetical protein
LSGNRSDAIPDYKEAVKYLDNYPDKADAQVLILVPISEIEESK